MKEQTRTRLKFDNKTIDKIKIEDLDFSYINIEFLNIKGENLRLKSKIDYCFSLGVILK